MKKIIVAIFIGLQILGHSQGLLTNLKGCYQLDCDGAMDYSQPGIIGTTIGVSCATGHLLAPNTCYQFAGTTSSKILLNNSVSMNSTSQICISGWYYIPAPVSTAQYIIYTNSGCSSNPAYALQVIPFAGPGGSSISFRIQKSGCGSSATLDSPSINVASGGWFHVVFYISNSSMQLWVNNQSVSTTINFGFTYSSSPIKPIVLGGTNETTDMPFVGKMDNIRFYDRQLSNLEITDIYTNDPSCTSTSGPQPPQSGSLGNYCSGSPNAITSDYQIPLNNFNFNFTTQSNSTSKILVGNNSCMSGTARLIVADDNIGNGIYGMSSTSSLNNIGVRGLGIAQNGNINTFGILGECVLPPGINGNNFAGVAGFCNTMNSNTMPMGETIGIYGHSLNGGNWAGYFDGDIQVRGIPYSTAGGIWSASDKRFKKDITPLINVVEKIKLLKSYTYKFKTEDFKNMNFSKEEQIGLIAQELKEVFPQTISEKNGYNYVNYSALIPVLIAGINEQQTKLEEQEETLKQQQQQINELKELIQSITATNGKSGENPTSLYATLGDKTSIVLDQNVPNPCAESTIITYNIPTDFSKAEIVFTTNNGILIKSITITEKGKGSLTVFANDLSHGVYTYTLVVDGKSIDSKKMIKE